MRTLLMVSLVSILAAGCKDKPKRKAPPVNPSTPTATPDKAAGRQAPDLELPHSTGGPPVKTTKPHTKADYEKLAKLEFPGFKADVRTVGEKAFEVRQITKDHPILWATITIQPCFDCVPMELDKWKAKTDELRVLLGPLKDSKDVVFEVEPTHLNGAPAIGTYQLGNGTSPGDVGGPSMHFTNAYAIYFNDGVNQIRVVGEYKDDPVSIEEAKKIAPKSDLAMVALSFLDVYTHAW